jgi:UDP-glucose 4-epimerase
MKKVVVTGAAGFIGSHLCKALVTRGYWVHGVDDLSRGSLKNLKNLHANNNFVFTEGSATNYELLSNVSKDSTALYHLGDESDIKTALMHPESYFKKNMSSLMSVLLACRDNRVSRLFFPSSTTVFGSIAKVPIRENFGPLLPESLYGASKVSAEAFLKAWSIAYTDTHITILRFAAIIGDNQDHGVVHDFVKSLSSGSEYLKVLGNGNQLRSFVLVDDCVNVVINLTEMIQSKQYEVTHLGNSEVISIRNVAEIVCNVLGHSTSKVVYEGNPLGWVGDSLTNELDCTKLDNLGIKLMYSSREAVKIAAERLMLQYTSNI